MSHVIDHRQAAAAVALFLAILIQPGAAAQSSGEDAPGTRVQPVLGFALGGGSFPRAFEPNCVDGWAGSTASGAIGLRMGLTRGPLAIEAHTSAQTEMGFGGAAACFGAELPPPDGIRTVRSSPIERGPFVMTDLRARVALKGEPLTWLITGGAGRVWSRGVSTLVFGTGIRVGRELRGVLDIDVTAYRIPWDEITNEWFDGELVRELNRFSERTWQRGVSVLVGLEVLMQW